MEELNVLDLIVRSRSTILEILENRGFNADSYKGVSPHEIYKFATTSNDLLTINAVHKEETERKCHVIYWVESSVRLRLESLLTKLWPSPENPSPYNPATDEFIFILNEPVNDAFHHAVIYQWNMHKARISFFNIKNVITNPAHHYMVPPHRKLRPDEVDTVIHGLRLKSRAELPHIKFHFDMQARVLGLVPGDIVQITRPSETAGTYTLYRVCAV